MVDRPWHSSLKKKKRSTKIFVYLSLESLSFSRMSTTDKAGKLIYDNVTVSDSCVNRVQSRSNDRVK